MEKILCLFLALTVYGWTQQPLLKRAFLGPHWPQLETVDDSIRGGKSQSYVKHLQSGILFYGTLDPSVLGAGFCSQRLVFYPPRDLSQSAGLVLYIPKGDNKTYTINVSNETPTDRGDGRKQSAVQFKHEFKAQERVVLYWSDFHPSYRGRPSTGVLDLTKISQLSIMFQSFFQQQQGTFELQLDRMELLELE